MKSKKQTALSTRGKRAVARPVKKELVTVIGPLNASSLKNVLWDTLNDIRTNQIQANRGDAVASQAREILRTIKTQLSVASAAKRGIPKDIIHFAEN